MVFTGGYSAPRPRARAIRQSGLFAYLVQEDTYQAASKVHDLLVKTHPADRDKIRDQAPGRGPPRRRRAPGAVDGRPPGVAGGPLDRDVRRRCPAARRRAPRG